MANTPKSPDVLADFKIAPARKVQYEPSRRDGLPVVTASEISASATAHRGKRVRDGLPVFYVQDGSAQPFALPMSVFAGIVASGLVSATEIAAMLAPADRKVLADALADASKQEAAPA